MSILNQDRLIISVISKASKEDAAAEQGPLQGLDIDVDPIRMPGIGANDVRDDRSKYSIKV